MDPSKLKQGHEINQTAVSEKIKRKLPSPVFSGSSNSEAKNQTCSTDDPSSHQGRKRIRSHVDGDWPTHVYISINIPLKIKNILNEVVKKLIQEDSLQQWHSFLDPNSNDTSLHLSLSRPIFLKTNERHAFLEGLKKAIGGVKLFEIHFATLSSFMNDDGSRGFLALEVGSGHSLLQSILGKIDKVLESHFLPKYYSAPQFHVSIAWCLMDQKCDSNKTSTKCITNAFMQILNNSGLDEVRKLSWKIQDINVVIGKSNHQLALEK